MIAYAANKQFCVGAASWMSVESRITTFVLARFYFSHIVA